MPGPLKNSRQERFALELFKGATATAAYVKAGYKPSDSAAARLSGNVRIAERVAELHAEAAEIAKVDAAWVLEKSVKLLKKCEEAGDRANAKGVLKMIGEHVAIQAFRTQVGIGSPTGGPVEYRNLSDDEINARIAAHEAQNADRPTAH